MAAKELRANCMSVPEVKPPLLAESLPEGETVFPSPFTPFERLKLIDDRPTYPMTILIRMMFLGELQEAAFRGAIADTMANHPLLDARAEWRGNWPWWVARSPEPVPIEWRESVPPEAIERAPQIDLLRGPGVRFLVHASPERSSFVLQIHHSCSDGQGSRRFIYDFCSNYERRVMGDASLRTAAKFDALLRERLTKRAELNAPHGTSANEGDQGTTTWERLRNTVWFFTKRPTPLAAPQTTKASNPNANRAHEVLLETDETSQLRQRALAENATFNDVAMAILMRVVAQWNREHARSSERTRVRIIMPTDLRVKDDDRSPAANRMGYAFPTRSYGETGDWRQLLASIREETEYIKNRRLGADFLTNIALAQAVPGLLATYLNWTRCLATATLTNLGDVTRRLRRHFPQSETGLMLIGGLPLLSVAGIPPLRPGTRAGIGLCVCGGRLSVSLLTDPFYFSDSDTRDLLNRYVAAIRCWNRGEEMS